MANRTGVGLVVVSHSRTLARAAVALATEMLHGRGVNIEVAAGLDDATFGTDAVRIKEAIERVDGPDGVVVLMDLGSAVLSAEMALDLLADPSVRDRVILSPAPIVEGLIVAAVAAAGGATMTEVAAEARGSLLGKAAHLGPPAAHPGAQPAELPAPAGDIVGTFVVVNRHGLHARPAARLVGAVRGLDATVQLTNLTTGYGPVPAASLSRVATLGALAGHKVEVRAVGPQAQEAVEHLLTLARRRFDEVEPLDGAPPAGQRVPGPGAVGASAGIGIGPARRLTASPVLLDGAPVGDPASEWRLLVESVAEVRRDIEHVRVQTLREAGPDEAGIFDAHLTLLADSEMLADVKTRIGAGLGAASAWDECLREVEQQWSKLPDPYLRQRAEDVHAVGQQVLRALTGAAGPRTVASGILVARDLTPGDAAGLDVSLVKGVVLAAGSATSHAAILARARDIPLVVSAGRDVLAVPDGTTLVIDGGTGELHIDPTAEVLEEFGRRADRLARRRAADLALAQEPAVSTDGVVFEVAANVGSAADARVAAAAGADGVGLVRTEFLFLGRASAPSLDEQVAQYTALAEPMAGQRVTVRTLDVGGDKPLPYLAMPVEQNPFLGLRGIRLSLDRPELLHEQLDAICRTAREYPLAVMFPMVSSLGELLQARQVLADAAGPAGLPAGLKVGVMIEVPAAALKIDSLLPYLDFVSIGTNDLTQYTLAAERGNTAVASISDALDPAVLALVNLVCQRCDGRVEVAVCGEAASDDLAIPVLVGLGVRELSVAPSTVPRVKAALRELNVAQCSALAEQALTLPAADEVRKLVLATLSTLSPSG